MKNSRSELDTSLAANFEAEGGCEEARMTGRELSMERLGWIASIKSSIVVEFQSISSISALSSERVGK